MAKVTIAISLDDIRDADILEWLGEQANKSAAVRNALAAYIEGQAGDMLVMILARLERKIDGLQPGAVTSTPATRTGDAPGTEQAAASLDTLADL